MLRVIDSAAADSPPCGVAVIQANAGLVAAASRPTSSEIWPERTPRQKAASPSGPSSLSMFSVVPSDVELDVAQAGGRLAEVLLDQLRRAGWFAVAATTPSQYW